MSTKQTDAHNASQQDIFEGFVTLLEKFGYEQAKITLDQMTETDYVDPKTYGRCKAHLLESTVGGEKEEEDPDSRGQELQEQADERREEQMDTHFAPAEGNVY